MAPDTTVPHADRERAADIPTARRGDRAISLAALLSGIGLLTGAGVLWLRQADRVFLEQALAALANCF